MEDGTNQISSKLKNILIRHSRIFLVLKYLREETIYFETRNKKLSEIITLGLESSKEYGVVLDFRLQAFKMSVSLPLAGWQSLCNLGNMKDLQFPILRGETVIRTVI